MSINTQSKLKKIKGNKQKLKLFRSNDPLKSVLMWGVNYSMSQLAHVNRRPVLMEEDFKGYMKAAIENHQFNKEYMPSHYKFKEYAPMVFYDLRRRFEVNDKEYLESLTCSPPVRLKKTEKKLSSFMLTQDRKFAIQIISNDDATYIQSWLSVYHEHVLDQSGKTLLCHLLALYRLTVNDQHTHVVVMRNIHHPPGHITRFYLLEGIPDKQAAPDKDKKEHHFGGEKSIPNSKRRQCGDTKLITDEVRIQLPPEEKDRLINTLKNDMMFLEKNRITKFKLLFGLRDLEAKRYHLVEDSARNAMPAFSEEEDDEEVSGGARQIGTNCSPPDRTVAFESPLQESDTEEAEVEADSLQNISGNRIGPYGIRDRSDSSIIYYFGLVGFYRRRHGPTGLVTSNKERKTSVSQQQVVRRDSQSVVGGGRVSPIGSGGDSAAAGSANATNQSSGATTGTGGNSQSSAAVTTTTAGNVGGISGTALSDPPMIGNKQLSGRLLNSLTYCMA